MTGKKFTRDQVSKYTAKTDIVFIIDNVVYNATKYIDEHPGGREVFYDASGTDASKVFDDIGHSADAMEVMKKYVVGELVPEEHTAVQKRQLVFEETKDSETGSSSWKIVILVVLMLAVLYSYMFS